MTAVKLPSMASAQINSRAGIGMPVAPAIPSGGGGARRLRAARERLIHLASDIYTDHAQREYHSLRGFFSATRTQVQMHTHLHLPGAA